MNAPKVILAVVLAVTAAPRPADACSPIPPIGSRMVTPAPDVLAPTNTEIRIEYGGEYYGPGLEEALVRPLGGMPVDATVEVRHGGWRQLVVVRPLMALAPATTYEVLDKVVFPCSWPSEPCIAPESAVVATFTTAAGTDAVPPTFAGITDVTTEWVSCDQDACCGPYFAFVATLHWEEGEDDWANGSVRYNIYRSSPGGDELVVSRDDARTGGYFCSGVSWAQIPGEFTLADGERDYWVRAVDLAGNEDSNTVRVPITISCTPPPIDAGPTPPPDAAPPAPDAPAPPLDDDGGCSCRTAPRPGGPAALLPLLLLSLSRVSRSRRR